MFTLAYSQAKGIAYLCLSVYSPLIGPDSLCVLALKIVENFKVKLHFLRIKSELLWITIHAFFWCRIHV